MRLRLALGIAALSGFVALSYEIVWYRMLSVMTRGMAATFGLLLGAYLFGLAFGSRISGFFCKGSGGDPRELRILALFVAVASTIAALVGPAFAWSAHFTDYRIGLALVAVGAAFLGAVLPLVSHFGIAPDDRAGTNLSYVYLANIIGSAAGSLITGFVLMDRMPLVSIARALCVAGFALAAGLLATSRMRGPRAAGAHAALVACSAIAIAIWPRLYDRFYEKLILKNEYTGEPFAEIVETKSGVITVAQDGTVYGGGAYDGVLNTSLVKEDLNGIARAYIVGALHPAPRQVLMVGLSSGSWAQVVAHLPGVEHVTIIEINPGYVEIIARHPEVSSLLTNPKVTIVFDDGRRWLRRHPDARFDFIVMNTTQHWRAHATNVLSADFMQIARKHFAPGGILYFNTTDSYDIQLTAAKTFPHFKRVRNFVAVSDAPFDFDRPRWRELLSTMKIEGKPVLDLGSASDKAIFDDLMGFNDMEPAWSILDRYEKKYRIVTDDNMVVEFTEPLHYPDLN
jgi:spermidine synthase